MTPSRMPADEGRRARSDSLAPWRALGHAAPLAGDLPRRRRRAVLAVFRDRLRLEAALAALPGLGFGAARFGLLGTPAAFGAVLGDRYRAAPVHGLGPFLVLDDAFAGPGGSLPVMKALLRLPGGPRAEPVLVSDGWPLPLPPDPAEGLAGEEPVLHPGGAPGPSALLLGLRPPDTRSAAVLCRTLLAISDGPVELRDLRVT